MAWTTADIPDQTGRVAVVTGANGGLGLETARELARKGARVVMAARNMEKAGQARADILGDIPGASLELQRLDLASLASVRAAAERILSIHDTIDLLINNAGVMALPQQRTEDGLRDAVRDQPLGALRLHRIADAGDSAQPGRSSRHRHQHRAPLSGQTRPRQSPSGRPLRALASIRPIQDGQRPLRPRAAAPARGGRILRAEPRGPPRVRQHRPPGQQRPPDRWWPEPALLSTSPSAGWV